MCHHLDFHIWLNYSLPFQAKLGNRRPLREVRVGGDGVFEPGHIQLSMSTRWSTFFLFSSSLSFVLPSLSLSFPSFVCSLHQLITFMNTSMFQISFQSCWQKKKKNPSFSNSFSFSSFMVNFAGLNRRSHCLQSILYHHVQKSLTFILWNYFSVTPSNKSCHIGSWLVGWLWRGGMWLN